MEDDGNDFNSVSRRRLLDVIIYLNMNKLTDYSLAMLSCLTLKLNKYENKKKKQFISEHWQQFGQHALDFRVCSITGKELEKWSPLN